MLEQTQVPNKLSASEVGDVEAPIQVKGAYETQVFNLRTYVKERI
jgi:hypothetical protein